MSFSPVVKLDNVCKSFRIYDKPSDRLKQLATFNRKSYFTELSVLTDISIQLFKGETLGIVGKNGSGKSTLLQLVTGVLAPTSGSVATKGRIGALLELGSGFSLEFTGRENIFLYGLLIGLTKKELEQRLEDILDFAEIGDFVDRPLKTYSSGMILRLAFAVHAQTEPEILIVDEALAVGDARFQSKCFSRLQQLKTNGCCILFVSHDVEQIVKHCDKAIFLHDGSVEASGKPNFVVNRYLDYLFQKPVAHSHMRQFESLNSSQANIASSKKSMKLPFAINLSTESFSSRAGYNPNEYRWGDNRARILDFYLENDGVLYPSKIKTGTLVRVKYLVKFFDDLVKPIVGINIKTVEGITVFGTNTDFLSSTNIPKSIEKNKVWLVDFEFNCILNSGDYFISVGIASILNGELVPNDRRYDSINIIVVNESECLGLVDLNPNFVITDVS